MLKTRSNPNPNPEARDARSTTSGWRAPRSSILYLAPPEQLEQHALETVLVHTSNHRRIRLSV